MGSFRWSKAAILALLLPSVCLAKEYHFVFDTQTRDKLEYKTKASDWDTAFQRAADFCGDFLMKRGTLNEDRILYITDVCANPREKSE